MIKYRYTHRSMLTKTYKNLHVQCTLCQHLHLLLGPRRQWLIQYVPHIQIINYTGYGRETGCQQQSSEGAAGNDQLLPCFFPPLFLPSLFLPSLFLPFLLFPSTFLPSSVSSLLCFFPPLFLPSLRLPSLPIPSPKPCLVGNNVTRQRDQAPDIPTTAVNRQQLSRRP